MAGFSVKVDDAAMKRQMADLAAGMANLTPAMKAFGEFMIMRTEERFSGEHDPEGRKWAPLSAVTYARTWGKKRKFTRKGAIAQPFRKFILGKKILTTSHRMRRSVTYTAGQDSMRLGSNVIYYRIHQLGGMAGKGHKVRIPARPSLGFNNADIMEAIAGIKDQLRLGK